MSQEEGAERSHEATPKKLEDARKRGELVKSQDLAVWSSYLGAFLALTLVAPGVAVRLTDLGGTLFEKAESLSAPLRKGGANYGDEILTEALALIGLLAAPAAALVLAVLFIQQAFVFAPSKLEFKLSRISLLSNAKNKFGPSGLFEFAKSASKMVIYGGFMVWFTARNADEMVGAAATNPRAIAPMLMDKLAGFTIGVVVVSGCIAALDYFWQRHTHLKKNMMTRQEVLDESKQSEGDPFMRAKRRQRAEEIAMNKMLKDVPDAAVVVVNPTHYAVALKWSPMDPSPPICLAKGVDNVALKIREIANDAGVPIFSDPPTARMLFASVEIGDPIDRAHFMAVAAAIRFARDIEAAQT